METLRDPSTGQIEATGRLTRCEDVLSSLGIHQGQFLASGSVKVRMHADFRIGFCRLLVVINTISLAQAFYIPGIFHPQPILGLGCDRTNQIIAIQVGRAGHTFTMRRSHSLSTRSIPTIPSCNTLITIYLLFARHPAQGTLDIPVAEAYLSIWGRCSGETGL